MSAVSEGTSPAGDVATAEDVEEAIRVVIDPELGMSVVDLGLVYGVEVSDGTAVITYTLTSMGCPVGPLIEQQFKAIAASLPGIDEVECKMTFEPPWSPEKMSEEARAAMGMF